MWSSIAAILFDRCPLPAADELVDVDVELLAFVVLVCPSDGWGHLDACVGLEVSSVVAYLEFGFGPVSGVVPDDDGLDFIPLGSFFFFGHGDVGDHLVDSLDQLGIVIMPVREPLAESDKTGAVYGVDSSVGEGVAFVIAFLVDAIASSLGNVFLLGVPLDFP